MMVKKTVIIFIIVSLFSIYSIIPLQAQYIPTDRLEQVESLVYGETSNLSFQERISNLEVTFFNQKQEGLLLDRVNSMVNYVFGTNSQPSIFFILNSIEWVLTGNISQGNIMERLDSLEEKIMGQISQGSYAERMESLADISLSQEDLPAKLVMVEENSLIRIRLLEDINSAYTQVGEKVPFEVVNDFRINGALVIPRNTKGIAKVKEVNSAGAFWRSGGFVLELSPLVAMDGKLISVSVIERSHSEDLTRELAVVSGLLGTVILGNPVGLVMGLSVRAKDEVILAEREFNIQTLEETNVFALEFND